MADVPAARSQGHFAADGGTLSGIAGPLDMPASGPPSAGTAPSPPAEAPETL